MKTREEWLKTIKSKKVRNQALKNLLDEHKDKNEISLSESIIGSFDWLSSPQGHEYRSAIYDRQLIKEKS